VDSRLSHLDDLGEWLDGGGTLVLGVVETASAVPQSVDQLVDETLRVVRRLQIADPGERLLLGTACGLAGWDPRDIEPQLRALRRAAELSAEALLRG
jgi:methionine synthase II (cobalamin-independent)